MTHFPISDWQPPEDPIFGLNTAFRNDPRPNKVNLGVGAYRTSEGNPYILPSVREAEHLVWEKKLNKEYLPIDGDPDFCCFAAGLVLGTTHKVPLYAAQTLGGTGALRIGGEYLAMNGPKTIFLPNPTWPNHKGVFTRAGLKVETYPYFDKARHIIDFDGFCVSLSSMPSGSIVLLHACCHNPTGTDLTSEQWHQVSELIRRHSLIPFFDFAYQGFGEGIEADAQAIRYFTQQGIECLVAYSFAKNFGLYSERVGLLLVVTKDQSAADLVGRQIKTVIRTNYSNPASHGARIVSTILQSYALKQQWELELASMRQRVGDMRIALVEGVKADPMLLNQRGLFTFGLLDSEQVGYLRDQFAIYLPDDGRINVAGLNASNLNYVVEAIMALAKT